MTRGRPWAPRDTTPTAEDAAAEPASARHLEMVQRCLRRSLFNHRSHVFLANAEMWLEAGHALSQRQVGWLESLFDTLLSSERTFALEDAGRDAAMQAVASFFDSAKKDGAGEPGAGQ